MTESRAAVWFDLDGTLITYDTDFESIFEAAVGDAGPEVVSTYSDAVLTAIRDGVRTPYESAFATTVETTSLTGDPASLAADYVEAELAATTVQPGAEAVVELAADAGPTGVVTNGGEPVQRRKLAVHDLASPFDAVVVSGAYGVAKPDPELFHRAAALVSATTHVYVGNSVEDDVRGAHDAGWEAVLVTDAEHPTNGIDVAPPDRVIEDLRSVATVEALTGDDAV